MTELLSSAATGRLDLILRRAFASLLGFMSIELWFRQNAQREQLTFLSDIVLVALLLSVLAVIVSAWLVRGNNLMLGIHGAFGLLSVPLFPAMSLGSFSIDDYGQPWIWFTVSLSAISVAVISGLRLPFYSYLAVLLVAWQILSTTEWGGNSNFAYALQDTLFIFFLTGGIAGLISIFRSWAVQVDQANSIYLASTLDSARVWAYEAEDQRINALVHDSMLHAFLFAAAAKTPKERQASATRAVEAADKISKIDSTNGVSGSTTPNAVFRALGKAVRKASPGIQVLTFTAGAEVIPVQVGQAITEATLQAVDNAVKHSNFTKLELRLDSPIPGTISAQVIDNGKGFRPERVPNIRIGIRGSIVTRMGIVGGLAEIKSGLNTGTTVSLRWPK